MKQLYANNAKTTLSLAITPSSTSVIVSDASRFPIPANSSQYFEITIELGDSIEVLRIANRTGNTLTVATDGRGIDGTTAATFGSGAKVECRTTAGMLSRFTTAFSQGGTVEQLASPLNSLNDGYVCNTLDSFGNPVIVYARDASTWRSLNYTVSKAVAATSGNTTSAVLPGTAIGTVVPGRYVIQFTSGANAGLIRVVSSHTFSGGNGTFNWSVPLPTAIGSGDILEIWVENAFYLTNPKLASGIPLSGLVPAALAESNAYLCTDTDEVGAPVVALSSGTKWGFPTHGSRKVTGAVQAGTTSTQVISSSISTNLGSGSLGSTAKFILQFTSGALSGQVRRISSVGTNSAQLSTATSVVATVGDTFEIYQSNSSVFASLDGVADESLVNAIIFGG